MIRGNGGFDFANGEATASKWDRLDLSTASPFLAAVFCYISHLLRSGGFAMNGLVSVVCCLNWILELGLTGELCSFADSN